MKDLIAFPVLAVVLILQTAVVGHISLLSGYGDLMLVTLAAWALQKNVATAWHWAVLGGLLVGFVSGIPWGVPLIGYLLMVAIARLLQRRVWQAPILAMFAITLLGTLLVNLLSLMTLRLLGDPLPIADSLSLIILPSLFINLLLAVPVYLLIRDLARWIYPMEEEA
jgi:rod shape-determining protein MreD